jgi:hypothetical protein
MSARDERRAAVAELARRLSDPTDACECVDDAIARVELMSVEQSALVALWFLDLRPTLIQGSRALGIGTRVLAWVDRWHRTADLSTMEARLRAYEVAVSAAVGSRLGMPTDDVWDMIARAIHDAIGGRDSKDPGGAS